MLSSAVADQSALRLPNWLLVNRNFVLLWAAYGISAFGDHLSEMALLQEAGGLERDDITRVQALMTFCFFIPFVFCGPIAGWWADRFSRKWTMIAADVIRAATIFSVPFILSLPPVRAALQQSTWGDFIVAVPLLLTGLFAAFFSPCRQAMVPTLIRDDQLVRANAMISALGTIGAILSAIVGGLLVDLALRGTFGLRWNYWLDAATFMLSAVLLLGIAMQRTRAVPHPIAPGIWQPIRAGFRYVRQHRRILQVILLGTVFWAGAGVVISVVPAIVRDIFGGQYTDAGMYRGLIAAGLAIGAALLTLVGPALPIPLAVLFGVAGGAFWVAALDTALIFQLGRAFTGVCLLMIGVHGAGILVTIMVVIQRFVPDSRRGRVFGVSDMCTMAAIVATTGLLGLPHIPHLDTYIPYLLAAVAAGLFITAVIAWRTYRHDSPLRPAAWLVWRLVQFYSAFWCRARRIGPCTVPHRGPVIIAANHTTGVDPLVILGTCTHRITSFLVEQKFYHGLPRWFMQLNDCIPVDRDRPTKSFLSGALRLLKADGCLGIFPQGTYEPPDAEQPGAKPGVGLLALRTNATIIPCHLSGTTYAYNPIQALFYRHSAQVRYGPPVNLDDLRADPRAPGVAQQASDRIMAAIFALNPQHDEP